MWPFSRRQRQPSEATDARIKAEVALRYTRAETPRYQELGEALREVRERNNFREAIEASFRGGRS